MNLRIKCDNTPLFDRNINKTEHEVMVDIDCPKNTSSIRITLEGELTSTNNLLKYYVLDKFCRRSRCIDKFRQFLYFLNYDTLGRRCLRDTKNIMASFMKCDGKMFIPLKRFIGVMMSYKVTSLII